MTLTINVNEQEAQMILSGLAELPAKISIDLILKSSISGSKISETLRLNMESIQRSHRSEVLKAIKKSEVWLLGPLGLCFLPTFMLIAVVPLIGSLITGFMS